MANANVWVTEFRRPAKAWDGAPISAPQASADDPPVENNLTDVATAKQTSAFDTATRLIRITANGVIHWKVGSNPTATTASPRLASGQVEYVGVKPGEKLSAIDGT